MSNPWITHDDLTDANGKNQILVKEKNEMQKGKDDNYARRQSCSTKISIPTSNVHTYISSYDENKGNIMNSSEESTKDEKICCTSTGDMKKKQWKKMAKEKGSMNVINTEKRKLQINEVNLVDIVIDAIGQM